MTFDARKYKSTTRQQWDDAAEAWHRWGPTLETWLRSATDAMMESAGVELGSHVLDVAAGAGGQSLIAAERVGPTGRVVATDISPAILACAAKAAADAGLDNVETLEADGEDLTAIAPGTFDAVITRLGLIYFPDQQAALSQARRALRDGGRFAAIVYSTPDRNGFFSVPVSIIRERAKLPAPQPGQPGPFSLGAPGALESVLSEAGFREVRVETVPSPLRLSSAPECLRFERESFGALHQMLSGLDAPERDRVWTEIESALTQFETADGFVGPCELLVASAVK